ncbi:MAG TPA: hypothetical protein IAB31_09045 [Candidatus Choladousia intestinavium]|uniref:HTH cro/C1-type domain-containing protein n=1 Tax=Candidatus Choladousia intestinavium TaxID=2840727 RepID=A0A9D1DA24_9FIRM|nr:hypothetical protein [Candidatus Choladousia intestinavium]
MNKFAEYCRQLLEAEDTNLYRFCNTHNLERTGIRRMLSGERLPKPELFQAFVDALTLTPAELRKLSELYERQRIGEERFQNRIFIGNMLAYIGELQNFQKRKLDHVLENWEIPEKPVASLSNHMEIIYMIQWILQTEKGCVYSNIPMDCPDFFQLLQQEFSMRKNTCFFCHFLAVLKKSEISFDVNYNLRLMKNILPFALQDETDYHPFYYYSNFCGRDSVALYPFYLLSSNYLLLLGEDFHRGILYRDKIILESYHQEIRRVMDRAKPFIYKENDPRRSMEYYMRKCISVSQPIYMLEYYPCIFQGYDRDLFAPFVKDGEAVLPLAEAAEQLVNAVVKYKPFDSFLSKEGLERFVRLGELSGQFTQVLHPFSKEARREILRRIEERCRTGAYRLHLLSEKLLNPFPRIGLELYENRTLALISCAGTNSYLVLEEKTLFGAFEDYFHSLLEKPEVTSVDETIQILEELQASLR